MSDELGTAVVDAVETSVNTDISAQEPTESTASEGIEGKPKEQEERQDNRRQPDALKKHIADLRRRADAITDPVEKKAELDRIKFLYDISGKARAYEEQFPTVREVREVKALLDSVGGREGVTQMQSLLSEVEQIDQMLSAGDASVIDRLWQEAPEGMPKLVPAILDRFAKEKPQEYEQFIAPKSIGYLDQSGFPQAFDAMVKAYEANDLQTAQRLKDELIRWVVSNRQQAQQQKQTDPEVERLRKELEQRNQKEEAAKVDTAYNAVISHAGPEIDKHLKPAVAKLGLSPEAYAALRSDVWNHFQDFRNNDATYKTVAPAKQRQGYDAWTEYAKRWTADNIETSVRAVVKTRYGHQLQNGAKQTAQTVTKAPGSAQIVQGKEPLPSEIDYGPKGKFAAQKAGFKDVADMILSGQAPLKAGGIRKWR